MPDESFVSLDEGDPASASIAVVLPVHNEAHALERNVSEFYEKVASKLPNMHVLITEDGSTDGTQEILAELSRRYQRITVQSASQRKGYSKAVRDAIVSINDSISYLMFMDSDGQYDPRAFFVLWVKFKETGSDMVMARRLNRAEPFYRVILSFVLNLIERSLFGLEARDVTSAFRVMKTSVAKRLAADTKYSRYNFWSEFTARAALAHYSIVEVPVSYRERKGGSKVYGISKMPRIVLNELSALLKTFSERAQYKP